MGGENRWRRWIKFRRLHSPPGHFVEMYSYTAGGLMTKKRMAIELENAADGSVQSNYAEAQYAYDSEGRRTQMTYPRGRWRDLGSEGQPWIQDPGRTLDYTYDAMGRLHTMAEPYPAVTWVNGVTYNAAGQATQIGGETRTYNIIGQLTRIASGSNFDERYDYHATQNDGRITGKKNLVSGEEVLYAYDSLQRLASAITVTDANVTQWGQSFTYDGWGNLLGAAVVKGSAPAFSITVDGATNRVNGTGYDANGNQTGVGDYDVENRLSSLPQSGTPGRLAYGYDAANKRVSKHYPVGVTEEGAVLGEETLMFYGAGGERLAEFQLSAVQTFPGYYLRLTERKTLVWFGSKLLRDGKYNVVQDRLGSVRWRHDTTNGQTETVDYYPYGQEKPGATMNDREKFATYLRDSETGLDYADQRYHQPGWGRFLTPDPYQASGGPASPGSWNRYAYVEGDPVNRVDPKGLFWEGPNLMALDGGFMSADTWGGGYGMFIASQTMYVPEGPVTTLLGSLPLASQFGGGGEGSSYVQTTPSNRGGWDTDPAAAAKVGWQYLTSIWKDCLDAFNRGAGFEQSDFKALLQNGINWHDTRNSRVGSRTVHSVVGNGDQTTLKQAVGASNAVVLGDFTPNVALGVNYFTDNTQTQQIAVTIHEALHVQMKMGDSELMGWLSDFGFRPGGNGTADITDWVSGGCKK